jgi:hypothetical protein
MKYIIYKITIEDYIYIGSTKNFTRRKCNHKSSCISNKDLLIYNKINELGGWKNCAMVPIEEYECENNTQAHIREECLRKEYDANLNTNRCHTTIEETVNDYKEYYLLNKAHINEKSKEYRQENGDKIKTHKHIQYEINKTKLLEDKKIYYEINKTKILESRKEYRDANKDKINERRKAYYQANKANTI